MSSKLYKIRDTYADSDHKEFLIESEDDIAGLPGLESCAIGSTALSMDGALYMLNADNEWAPFSGAGSSTGGSGSGSGSGLPAGGEPNKVLVTDADGNATWADRLAYPLGTETITLLDSDVTLTTIQYMPNAYVKENMLFQGNNYGVTATAGTVLTVNFNGVEYTTTVRSMDGSVYFGNPGEIMIQGQPFEEDEAGIPFAFALMFGGKWMLIVQESEVDSDNPTVHVTITTTHPTVKPIDAKYIPLSVQQPVIVARQNGRGNYIWDVPFSYVRNMILNHIIPVVFVENDRLRDVYNFTQAYFDVDDSSNDKITFSHCMYGDVNAYSSNTTLRIEAVVIQEQEDGSIGTWTYDYGNVAIHQQ